MSIHSWMEDKRTREEYERLAGLARETAAQPSTEAVTEPGSRDVSPMYLQSTLRS
ncbi:MAG: hypothetical protein ACLR0U_30155 [Enterocloster clostridioformis]